MDLKTLNKICFMICIVCIVVGVVFSLAIIWASISNEYIWKSYATIGVVFVGSALTLSVSKTFGSRSSGDEPS
jgi:hypothetical protein